GASASTLLGGDGEDILIGGTTAYDLEMDAAALRAIMAYWTGTDDYATRVANLRQGMAVPLFDATTVHGNGGLNTLTAHSRNSPELNLYFGNKDLGDMADDTSDETFIPV